MLPKYIQESDVVNFNQMGRVYYIFSHGTLSRRENTILFQNEREKKFIPVEDIEELFILSEISLNSKLLNFLSQKGIVVHFFNYYGWYSGSFVPRETSVSGFLVVKQAEHYLDREKRLYLAREFVKGSIANSMKNIAVNFDMNLLDRVRDIETLMSLEAQFRKAYYDEMEKITGWEFGKRTKRPPSNPLNALISFGNSLVYATVLKEIYHTQLNPTISYLHEPSTKRFSLSLDIAEIFKPLISDRIILRTIGQGIIQESDFEQDLNYTYLSERGRKKFLKEFDKLLKTTYTHPTLKRKVSVRQFIRLELYKLIKHLIGEQKYRALRAWW